MTGLAPAGAKPASPLRSRLLWLAASGLVPLALVFTLGLVYLVHDRQAATERAALELSRAMAIAVEAELQSTVALLRNMAVLHEFREDQLESFHRLALRAVAQQDWRSVVLVDAAGRVLVRSSVPFGSQGPEVVERDSVAQVLATREPSIGRITDRGESADRFAVRVPVMRGGDVAFVLSAVLSTDRILKVVRKQNVPSSWVVAVFDQAGRRAARSVQSQSARPSPSLQALLDRGGDEGAGITRTLEGVESHTGFTRLKGSGWVVAVGISRADANAPLYAILAAVALGLAASLGLSALVAWLLSRRVLGPIGLLKQNAAALGHGDPVHLPPLGIAELDDVGGALMAAAGDRDRSAHERNEAAAERERLLALLSEALHKAEEAGRSKDEFLAVLGHELRNPLAPIATAVHLMALKGDDKTAAERRVIERQLMHVSRLVDDLLDISRITSHRLSIERRPVLLATVLAQAVENTRPALGGRGLSLALDDGAGAAWVRGDEVRLAQVFGNLLGNAVKFTGPQGHIQVRARLEGAALEVQVEDSGMGIAAAELGRIFELFYQAPQNSDRARGGLGLGLPIVRTLVEMHGGSVAAASAGPGQGSCFTVCLPLGEAPAGHALEPEAPQPSGAGKVLVVDDNRDAADTAAALLEMSGYAVRVVYTPEAALQALGEFEPQVAILDIGLPGMSGYELARRMRQAEGPFSGKLIALTGYGQAADMAQAREAGFDAHLTKPVSADVLLAQVARLALHGAEPASAG